MKLEESTRKYIFTGLFLFIIIGLITAGVMGKKQDGVFHSDELLYSTAVERLQARDYATALSMLESIEARNSPSEAVNYMIGLAASNNGEVEKGIRHMQRSLDINPHKVEDSLFMLQYGEMLITAEMSEEAQEVLERCAALPVPESFPQYQERVAELQLQLSAQS
ncbi:tetratricopeptide repeat protein [Sporosarcina ureilytica]|uniref:Uncharacterized protein n=1 Tax=Sporosarcina ureilytica TaxID=298596 RepID=A0A1D8JJA5_9BACL|nr:hypothetical protein [Sporosarcina ureilytica]AOV08793.1 hypothetical protein BI350_15395 [Sporosarcina ureilytica]